MYICVYTYNTYAHPPRAQQVQAETRESHGEMRESHAGGAGGAGGEGDAASPHELALVARFGRAFDEALQASRRPRDLTQVCMSVCVQVCI